MRHQTVDESEDAVQPPPCTCCTRRLHTTTCHSLLFSRVPLGTDL